MSWIFNEPLEGAVYARRAIAPPSTAVAIVRPFSPAARFHAVDLFAGDSWHSQQRAYSPLVARRSFRRPCAAHGSDGFADDPWTGQRRAYAPVRLVAATTLPFSLAGRVLASLLAADVFGDDFWTAQCSRLFQPGASTVSGDVGRSASVTVSAIGADASVTATFTGSGTDPYGPIGVSVATGIALGADTLRELAVQNPAVFGGASASRNV
jgi:hypothetical protein